MKTKNIIFILPVLFLFLGMTFIEQTTCLKSKLVGEWQEVSSSHYKQTTNIDSFINTVTDSTKFRYTWTFNEDGTFNVIQPKHKSKGTYTIDENKCELVLKKKENSFRKKINPIIYMDDKYLFLKIDNPHYSTTNFYCRK